MTKRILSLLLLSFLLAEPVWAGLPLSLNFRGTTAFDTDGAGETAVPESSDAASGSPGPAYPIVISGINMGWVDNVNAYHFDRSTTPAAKFAGVACNNGTAKRSFKIQLPSGSYTIAFAGGSYTALGWNAWRVEFFDSDGTTSFFALTTQPNGAGNSFSDHNDSLKTDSTWSSASPRTVTISDLGGGSGFLFVTVGNGTQDFSGGISHLEIAAVSAGAETFGFQRRRAQ